MKWVVVALGTLSAACAPALRPLPPVGAELPPLLVEQISITTVPPAPGDPPGSDARVTLTAARADVRILIPALAQIAGVSVVMDTTVRGAVAVRLDNVLAIDALHSVINAAGLAIEARIEKPWPESVFYTVPVNVNTANAGVISARFGVSREMAEFVVRSRRVTITDRQLH